MENKHGIGGTLKAVAEDCISLLKNTGAEFRRYRIIILLIAPVIILAGTFAVHLSLDQSVFSFSNEKKENRHKYEIMKTISSKGGFGGVAVSCVLLIACGAACRSRRLMLAGMAGLLASSSAGLTNNVIKFSGRPRPDAKLEHKLDDKFYGPKLNERNLPDRDYLSFPSGHCSTAFGAAVAISVVLPPAAPVALSLAGLVAFSRIYLLDHYPSDVFCGSMIGTCAGLIFAFAARKLLSNKDVQQN